MASLRTRLLLAVGAVVLLSVAAVGWVGSRVASVELHRFLRLEEAGEDLAGRTEELARRVEDARGGGAGWTEVEELLTRWQPLETGQGALVLSADDRLLAASAPALADYRYRATEGGLTLQRQAGDDGRQAQREQLELRLPHGEIADPAGEGARLYLLPLPGATAEEAGASFLRTVNRWLLAAVLGVGLLALLTAAAVARRLLGPVEELTAAAGDLAGGELSRRVEVRSVDEVGRLAAAFNGMAEALERQEALRRQMVSDTAHELRTPLTNLRCQLEALQDGVLRPDADTLASLTEETVHLQQLVDDLQELALADAGQLRLELEPLALADELTAAAKRWRRPDGPAIELELPPLPPVQADRRRLQQVLDNLLANAVAHTPGEGEIVISARARGGGLVERARATEGGAGGAGGQSRGAESAGRGGGRGQRDDNGPRDEHGSGADVSEVEVRIADSGPGIPPEHLPHLFQRFYRTDPSRQRATGGAGLGLAIVERLVTAHGGRIWAESPPGEGAMLAFTLPI